MGGYGSTRWGWHSPKDTIESSIGLKIAELQKYCQIGAPWLARGSFSWKPSGASISYSLLGQALTLSYRMRRGNGDAWQERQDVITLQATRPNYGGARWWFTCPICQRRAGAVYLDRERQRFSCRRCAGLAYRSQQEHNKTLDKYTRDPDLAAEMIGATLAKGTHASEARLIQAFKATELLQRLDARQMHKHRRR